MRFARLPASGAVDDGLGVAANADDEVDSGLAAARPQARCSSAASRPSSSISPAIRMRRFAGSEARVSIMEINASGLEL